MTVLLFILIPAFCVLVPIHPKFDLTKLYYECQEWESPDTHKAKDNPTKEESSSNDSKSESSSTSEATPEEIAESIYWEDL